MHSYIHIAILANPIACSAANATLELFKNKKVIEKNKKLSLHIQNSFDSLKDHRMFQM
jgi:adenosylmethionine-8-amino-7-oxononanoate aminotransferase